VNRLRTRHFCLMLYLTFANRYDWAILLIDEYSFYIFLHARNWATLSNIYRETEVRCEFSRTSWIPRDPAANPEPVEELMTLQFETSASSTKVPRSSPWIR